MMFDSFEAYDVQETRRISREEGERAGRIEGEQLYLIKQVIKRIIKNISVSQIAADLLEPLDTIQPIYDLSLIHISEPTRPLYISYAVFCLKKKK